MKKRFDTYILDTQARLLEERESVRRESQMMIDTINQKVCHFKRSKVTVPVFAFKHRPRYLCCTQYLKALCFCFIQTLFFVTVADKVMKFGIYV